MTGPVTVDIECTAQFPGGIGPAVQAETVTAFLGGEAVVENPGQVVRRNAHSIVADAEDLMNLQRMIARALDKSAALISLTKEIEHKFGPILDRENDE